jgi:Mg2+ and Co2+ transporter CorA
MQAILFDHEDAHRLDGLAERPPRLSGSNLLWVDLDRRSEGTRAEVGNAFDLDEDTCGYLAEAHDEPVFEDHGRYLHITTYTPREDAEGQLQSLECVVGQSWVITAHDQPIPVLDDFAARVTGSGDTGSLDGPGFLAALLEWVLGSYSDAFERIEGRLGDFDVDAMRGDRGRHRAADRHAPTGRRAASRTVRPQRCLGRPDPSRAQSTR